MMDLVWLLITLSSAVSTFYMAFCTFRCISYLGGDGWYTPRNDIMDVVISAVATVILFFITLFFYTLLVT